MSKTLTIEGAGSFTADKIVKDETEKVVTGYRNDGSIIFQSRIVNDFSKFTLADGEVWDQ